MPISPSSGRRAPPSHCGPPTAPSSTASAPRAAASVSGGSGSPHSSIADAAEGMALEAQLRRDQRSSRSASSITSGPTPSPGRATTRPRHASSPRVRSSRNSWSALDAVLAERAAVRREQMPEEPLLALRRAKRLLVLALVRPQRRDEPEPPVDEVDDLDVERRDLRAQAVDERILDVGAQIPTPSSASSASTSGSISIGS